MHHTVCGLAQLFYQNGIETVLSSKVSVNDIAYMQCVLVEENLYFKETLWEKNNLSVPATPSAWEVYKICKLECCYLSTHSLNRC